MEKRSKPNLRIISLLVLPIILLLSLTSYVSADSGGPRHEVKDVDGYKVKLIYADGDVHLGHNKLHIVINDPQAQPVEGAAVNVIAELYQENQEKTNSPSSHGSTGMDMPGMEDSPAATTESPVEETPVQTVKSEIQCF